MRQRYYGINIALSLKTGENVRRARQQSWVAVRCNFIWDLTPSPANKTSFWRKSAKGIDAPAAIAKRTNAAVALDTSPCCSTNLTYVKCRCVGRAGVASVFYVTVFRHKRRLRTKKSIVYISSTFGINTYKISTTQVWSSLWSRIWEGVKICVFYRCTVPAS